MEVLEKNSSFAPEIYSERIRKHKPLLDELEKCHIDIEQVSALFSYALRKNERWNEVSVQGDKMVAQSKDARKKVRKRHAIKPTGWHRDEMLRAYTKSAARRFFAKELISRKTGTKTRPHIQNLALLLYYVISQKTKRPYRLMAGLFHVFPELLDIGCRKGCPLYDKDQGICMLNRNIFLCKKHQTARRSIRQITLSAMKSYPPDMLTRLALSEKEID